MKKIHGEFTCIPINLRYEGHCFSHVWPFPSNSQKKKTLIEKRIVNIKFRKKREFPNLLLKYV